MKEDIKNIQSLQINIGGKTRTFNRECNVFKFSETNNFETVDGSYSYDDTCILSENVISNFEYTPLTYTEEYKQKLEDEYEAKLQNSLNTVPSKKRVRKYNQIAKKLEEYQEELEYANYNFDTCANKNEVKERITVLSNMIILLQWVLKQR